MAVWLLFARVGATRFRVGFLVIRPDLPSAVQMQMAGTLSAPVVRPPRRTWSEATHAARLCPRVNASGLSLRAGLSNGRGTECCTGDCPAPSGRETRVVAGRRREESNLFHLSAHPKTAMRVLVGFRWRPNSVLSAR